MERQDTDIWVVAWEGGGVGMEKDTQVWALLALAKVQSPGSNLSSTTDELCDLGPVL